MTLVLDSGGVTVLADHRARLAELRRRGTWPPVVPSIVLVGSLTGDHRRDHHASRLLRMCYIRPIGEDDARLGARLRSALRRPAKVSAADAAAIAALAIALDATAVLTTDPADLSALLRHHPGVHVARC